MRIVAIADTHLFHDELTIPPGDVLVHAGDFCRGGDFDESAGGDRRRVHLFGHIHHDGGAWQTGATLFANVTWECERAPTVIDVPSAGPVTLVTVPPAGRS